MKKRISALIILFVLCISLMCGCAKETVDYRTCLEAYIQTMDYHDGFTILQLTDIHWNGATQIGNAEYGSEEYLTKVINEAIEHTGGIDLIEVTGDTFMLAGPRAVRSFISFMEELGIPYAMTWGNHDREGKYNPNWLSRQFLNAEHCLYTEVDNDNVHERCNYCINLTDTAGQVCWQLIHLDSGASYREGAADMSLTYDYLRADQFEWMSAEHELAGASVPAICYYHIAQLDNAAAWDAIEDGTLDCKHKFFNHEGFCNSAYATSTEAVFAANNVRAVFCGHAHSTDWTYTSLSGITYGLGVKTGKELYCTTTDMTTDEPGFELTEDFELTGASLVTLNDTEGGFTLEHLYLNERDEGDFVMWVEY